MLSFEFVRIEKQLADIFIKTQSDDQFCDIRRDLEILYPWQRSVTRKECSWKGKLYVDQNLAESFEGQSNV